MATWKRLVLAGDSDLGMPTSGGTFSGDIQATGIYVGSTNTSYDFYNNGTTYLNGATYIDANLTFTTGSTTVDFTGSGPHTISGSGSGSYYNMNNVGTITPNSDSGFDLGKSTHYWDEAFIAHINSKDYVNIQIDDAEQYFQNTAGSDYWRLRRDSSNNFIIDHYNGSSTLTAMSFDSSQNLTLSKQLTIPNKIQHDGDTGTYLAYTDGQIDLKGSGGVRMMLSDNEAIYFYTGSSTTQALVLDTSQNATFGGNVSVGDGDRVGAGADTDIWMTHSTHSYIENKTGEMRIVQGSGDHFSIWLDNTSGTDVKRLAIAPDGDTTIVGSTNYSQLRIKGSGGESGIKFLDSDGNTDGYIYATANNIGFLSSSGNWKVKHEDSLSTFSNQVNVDSGALVVKAPSSTASYIYIQADNNANHSDNWRLSAETDNMFDIQSKDGGSWASVVEWSASDKAMYAKGNVYLSGTTLSLAGTSSVDSYLRFDGTSGDTYLHYNANDMIDVYTGGDIAMRIKDDDVELNGGLQMDGNLVVNGSQFDYFRAVNSGNPEFHMGSSDTNKLHIQTVYTSSAQTLSYVAFTTKSSLTSANAGKMDFYVDESKKLSIYDDGIEVTGGVYVAEDDGFVYLNNAGTGNNGVYVRGLSTDHMRYHVPADKTFHWEIGGVQKAQINTSGLQIGDAGNDTSTSLRVNTGIIIHKDSGTAGNDVSITFDRRNDGAYAYIKATAGDDGAYATNLQFITKGHNGSAYQTYTGLTIDDEGSVLIQGNTRLTSEGSTKRLKLHGSGDNYVLTGCYDDNGWAYFNSYNNSNGMQFYIDEGDHSGLFSFRNGKMVIGVESSGTATSANLFIIGANNAGDGIKIARGGDSQNALDQYAQLNMNQGTTNLISRGGTSGEGTIALQTTSDGSTHTNRLFVNSNGNIAIGTDYTSPDTLLHIHKATAGSISAHSDAQLAIENSGVTAINLLSGTTSHGQILFGDSDDADKGVFGYDQSTDKMYIRVNGSNDKTFVVNPTGTGIGTDSPDQTLHVSRGSAGTVDAISSSGIVLEDDTSVFMQFLSPNNADVGLVFGDPDDNDIGGIFYEHANNKLAFRTNTATALSIDSQGNMGLGVVPDSTWLSTRTAFQIGGGGSIFGRASAGSGSDISIGVNVYQHSGGSYRRLDEDVTTLYRQYLGAHEFKVAGSSTDNSTISYTDALKINNDANIGIGRTALGTAYGVGAGSILEIGSSATDKAGTLELVGNTNGADVAIGNILWRNEHNYYASGVNYWGGSGEGVARIQVSNVQGSSTAGEQGSEMTFWTKAFGGDCAKRLSLSSVGLATFTGDVKIAKASGSSTLTFVPATSQSSQIKFYQDDGSTQEARIFAPEGSKDLAFEAGETEMMRMTTTDATVGGDLIINGRTKTSHTYLKIQSNADNNYDAILQWDQESTMAWQLYNDGSDSDKLKLNDAGGTQIFEVTQDSTVVTAATWTFQSHTFMGDIYLSGGDIYSPQGAKCITVADDDTTFADDVTVDGALTVGKAYPFMINASSDWKATSTEKNMPFSVGGAASASVSTTSDLKSQYTWVAPFATTLRALYVTSETAVTSCQFKVEVASTYSVFVNGTATTTTTYTKSFTTGSTANISCGLSIAKGNAIRFSINPNSTNVDQFLVTFVFE